ncbi:hypothetical protein KAU19_01395 [Candidatus Parcubacteria bacterium]|nr:hypothetical protein [Candidatus Parcubacteria bacterium]
MSEDLIERYGRGFSKRNLEQMKNFYWSLAKGLCLCPDNKELLLNMSISTLI